MGEVRESRGTSPIPNRLYGKIGDVKDVEGMELDMPNEAVNARTTMTPASRAGGSAWELRRVDPSPVSTVMSITPRAGGRDRASNSPMPTPLANELVYSYDGNMNDRYDDYNDIHGGRQSQSPTPRPFTSQDHGQSFNDEDGNHDDYDDTNDYSDNNTYDWPNDQDWGDDAVMVWDATSGNDDDTSSVAPEEAGVMDDDDDDDWGKDAMLAWDEDDNDFTDQVDELSGDDHVHEKDDEEQVEETEDELVSRGMPNYRDWPIKDLQVGAYIWYPVSC
jgi:hypothetical protein